VEPCPYARSLMKIGRHVGVRISDGSASHLFLVDKNDINKIAEIRNRISEYRGDVGERNRKIYYSSSSNYVLLECPTCILVELYKILHVVNVKAGKDQVVVTGILTKPASLNELKNKVNPDNREKIVGIDLVKVEDITLNDKEEHIAKVLLERGYLEYPRRANINELCDLLGIPKSSLSYITRRIFKKALNQTV